MQLIITLIVLIAILTFLSGFSAFCGSKKKNKIAAAWFFVVTIGLVVWSIAIAIFLSLNSDQSFLTHPIIVSIITGITLADIGLIGYTGWNYKSGKILLVILSLVGIALITCLVVDPGVFYSSVSLNNECNRMEVVKGWYYFALMAYYGINTFTFLSFLLFRIRKTSNHNVRTGLIILCVGLSIGGLCSLLFDLIFLSTMPEYIWAGPVSISVTMICFYYAIVRFRIINLNARWMRTLSNIIFALAGISIYLVLFYVVFTALFHIPNPSFAVILLNLIMSVILLLLIPAVREIYSSLYSICSDKLEFDYVVRKINHINKKHFNIKELAQFLADNMHYSYVLFIIDGKIYSSNNTRIGADEIVQLAKIKAPSNGIWQSLEKTDPEIIEKYKVSRVGVLIGSNGEPFGQVVLGKKGHRSEPSRKNLIEYETVINLSALVIENGRRKS